MTPFIKQDDDRIPTVKLKIPGKVPENIKYATMKNIFWYFSQFFQDSVLAKSQPLLLLDS